MYLFLNHFSLEEPKEDIKKKDVIEFLENLGCLFIELKKINIDIIIYQLLSQTILINKPIREYLLSIEQLSTRQSLIQLFGKIKPFCSDNDTSFENDITIAYSNCMENVDEIDVLYTFLSCAMYYNNPILTVNSLCNKKQFFQKNIKITCDNGVEYHLDNYQLTPYQSAVEELQKYQKEELIDLYNLLDNWDDYMNFVNTNFKFTRITNSCIENLKNKFSYNNSYAIDFRNKVQRINNFLIEKGGNIGAIDFNELSKKHYAPESLTRYTSLKKSHSNIKNFKGEQVYLNWHTWVQDFRMYFEKEDEYISFIYFEKKIT